MTHPEKQTLIDSTTKKPIRTAEVVERERLVEWEKQQKEESDRFALVFGNEPPRRCHLLQQSFDGDMPLTTYLGEFPTVSSAKGYSNPGGSLSFLGGILPATIDWREGHLEGSRYGFTIPSTDSTNKPQTAPHLIKSLPRYILKWPFYRTWFGVSGVTIYWITESDPMGYEEPENLYATLDWGSDSYTFLISAATREEALQKVIQYMDSHPNTFGSEGHTVEDIQDSVVFHPRGW